MTHRPRLCATVTGDTTAELRARRDAATDADLVELRLDSVADPDVAGAIEGRTRPVILTCRAAWEGGRFAGSEEERRRVLAAAVASDAEYVDLEWKSGFTDLIARRQGRGIVVSSHDFEGVPAGLSGLAHAMAGSGAEIVKIAAAVTRLEQCAGLLEVSRQFAPGRSVVLGMGEAGLVTRVCAARFGSAWSYSGSAVAPGQVTPERMVREYGFRRVGAATPLFGVLGRPVSHSLSPVMHNAGLAALGIDAVYLPLPAADIEDVAAFDHAFALAGVSVTAPFKAAVLPLTNGQSALVRQTGAANTLTRVVGGFSADNTDVDGFLAPLSGAALRGARAAVLGNGGAARAAAMALREQGAIVTIYGRDAARARESAEHVGVGAAARPVAPGSWDLLVNATPVGTCPGHDESAFPEAAYGGALAYDLVYNPPETAFLREARAQGCRVIGGLEMLIAQARLQQLRWFGRAPDVDTLRDAALWKLNSCSE
jgi:3-dehydroquinate dehydratase / shikimate dehydrogenase